MSLWQIALLALIQGAAELLPVSSSAHVIMAEKWMGLDPSAPEMTYLLVMLHTGTMFAVLAFFSQRWKPLFSFKTQESRNFILFLLIATACTGVLGYSLKHWIEHYLLGDSGPGEIEDLFKNLPAIGVALFCVGVLIAFAGRRESRRSAADEKPLSTRSAVMIGLVQGLCLPFRGFSRSGATISTGMLLSVARERLEEFSFALVVILTPPIILRQILRLAKANGAHGWAALTSLDWTLFAPGLIGMVFAFFSGWVALKWVASWIEKGRWQYFGYYCFFASAVVYWVGVSGN